MATTTFACASDNTSDATFRAWVSALVGALTAVLVQTADTGQINVATVTRPATVNTSAGYVILRFSDALQATRPIFIKVEFGTGSNPTVASTLPQLWLTVGKGSDGAGNITGVLLARVNLSNSGANASVSGTTNVESGVASGGDGWAAFIPWIGHPGSTAQVPLAFFIIERVSNGDGVVVTVPHGAAVLTAPGKLIDTGNSSLVPRVIAITYATAIATVSAVPVVVPYRVAGSALSGSTALAAGAVGPVFPWVVIPPGLAPQQCIHVLSYPGGDAPGAQFQATLGGVTRTYYPVPLSDNHNAFGLAVAPADPTASAANMSRYVGLAIRWE